MKASEQCGRMCSAQKRTTEKIYIHEESQKRRRKTGSETNFFRSITKDFFFNLEHTKHETCRDFKKMQKKGVVSHEKVPQCIVLIDSIHALRLCMMNLIKHIAIW